MSTDSPAALLALVVEAQQKLNQLESTAKSLIEELAAPGGAQATPRLRELLTSGERLVAEVKRAGGQLAQQLPEGGAAAPLAPDRPTVDALWAKHAPEQQVPALLPTLATRPAATLQDLLASLQHLPGCTLQPLAGRQPVRLAAEATAVLLHCGRAFAAVVHLQGPGSLLPLRVGALSTSEAAAAMAGSEASSSSGGGITGSSSGSLWAPSRHAVFQQLSALAAAAMHNFLQQSPQPQPGRAATPPPAAASAVEAAASPLELLLLWLATCGDLFSWRSSSGGSLLLADPAAAGGGLLPPLHRPWQLSWQELWQAALTPQLRQAEHIAAG